MMDVHIGYTVVTFFLGFLFTTLFFVRLMVDLMKEIHTGDQREAELLDILRYWREDYTGAEPSKSIFELKIDKALGKAAPWLCNGNGNDEVTCSGEGFEISPEAAFESKNGKRQLNALRRFENESRLHSEP